LAKTYIDRADPLALFHGCGALRRGIPRSSMEGMSSASGMRKWLVAGAAVVVAVGIAAAATAMFRPGAPEPTATRAAAPTHSATPTPTAPPTPTRTGPAANTASYDLAPLPTVDVYLVDPHLPLDPAPNARATGLVAYPAKTAIPVFATPTGAPVASLAEHPRESGGAFPVITAYTDWVEVLLVGREGVPPSGNAHQTSGWLRRAEVRLADNSTHIVVNLSKHTIDLVTSAGTTRVADDFGWGTPATPTPVGRTFVMEVAVAPALTYTRGHPIVYLATQSQTLRGFDGQGVAVTAIHYHDAHAGAISNGCIRVDAHAIGLLDTVPPGTVVYIQK